MEAQPCVFLGIKVKPGPIERHKLENFSLDHTVDNVKSEAGKKTNLPSASLELIHHGKILKDDATLQDSGVKNGEMIHVVKKKEQVAPTPPPSFSDAELQQLNASLRTLGCTPNAPGWTRAMQLLNDESAIAEITEQAPSLSEDCVALSILHEVELLAALGANIQTMRRGADAHPELPVALQHLTRLVRSRSTTGTTDNVPVSGFAYSLGALSDDEDADEEEADTERAPITHEQLAAALQAATEAVSSSSRAGSSASSQDSLLRLLRAAAPPSDAATPPAGAGAGASRSMITPEMFSEAISEVFGRAAGADAAGGAPMDQSGAASSSQSPEAGAGRDAAGAGGAGGAAGAGGGAEDYSAALRRMHEMGLLDDALNVRALLIAAGDVNAAINLVFSGAIGDD